jgi:carboxyl-terminal processing protease
MKLNFNFSFLKNKFVYSTVLVACFVAIFFLGIWVGVEKVAYCVQQPGTINFSLFWDAYDKLKQNFVNPEKFNDQEIIYGAIEGMTKSLGDPYTTFFNPADAKKFQDDLSGSFEGIGAEIGIKKDQLTIVAPLKNTPAEKAGLKSGDAIVAINGTSTSNMTTDDAVDLIRGKGGTEVTLTIYREGWKDTKDIKIVRDTIVIPAMEWKILDNNVAYIQLYQFDDSLISEFEIASRQILQSNADKIILDLRNNPGGYLEVAQKITGWFLPAGQTVVIEDFGDDREQKVYKTDGDYSLEKYPIVVLINQGSASASEILAGALRDNKGIKLIGEKSFGKGSVQEVLNLRDGSYLKITIAKWLTPNGNSISEVGLDPDVKVENTNQDTNPEKDSQLEKALEIIKDLK